MKILILLFLFATVMVSNSAVNQSQEVKPQGTPLAIVQLGPKRSGPRTSYAVVSGFRDRRRMVIRDRETWGDVWKQIYSGPISFSWTGPGSEKVPNLPPPLPQIDFSHNMLLVVTMGSEPNGGYAIVVDGVYEHANQLEVVVRNVSPGRSCFTAQVETQPVDIVEVEKREGSVIFRDVDIVTDCSQMRRAP
ncbi:MAG: hypothetical protein QOK48_607 [Blastocatellia bacterium]|jgi:hypothetical protein|nr:hypothetical protein [Blastocatellia bacterium]